MVLFETSYNRISVRPRIIEKIIGERFEILNIDICVLSRFVAGRRSACKQQVIVP